MTGSGFRFRAQAALDFLISYGIVILAITLTLAVLYSIGINNSYTEQPYCDSSPGFACGFFAVSFSTGILQIQLAQSTGSAITVSGLACSTDVNATGDFPGEGNVHVTSNSIYYPSNSFIANTLYSGASRIYQLYCYNKGGTVSGSLGNGFSGYVWMNYTVPGYGKQVLQVATINAKFT